MSALTQIADVWQSEVVDAGREPAVFVLVSFLVTFGITRTITHAIRDKKVRFLRDMNVGETHLHHLVPGIILLLLAGLLGIAVDPPFPVWVIPVMFGIGAALTLDEFALWLHLKDVYWAQEGRRSIDAVVIAAALFGLSVIGYPFWFKVWSDVLELDNATLAGFHLAGVLLAIVCFSKGKLYGGVVGAVRGAGRADRRPAPGDARIALGAPVLRPRQDGPLGGALRPAAGRWRRRREVRTAVESAGPALALAGAGGDLAPGRGPAGGRRGDPRPGHRQPGHPGADPHRDRPRRRGPPPRHGLHPSGAGRAAAGRRGVGAAARPARGHDRRRSGRLSGSPWTGAGRAGRGG